VNRQTRPDLNEKCDCTKTPKFYEREASGSHSQSFMSRFHEVISTTARVAGD